MDESAFRQRISEVTARPCAFAKALLTSCLLCDRAERIQIAEREVIACSNTQSHSRCSELHDALRQSFSFALAKSNDGTPLSHTQELRVQCGGLQGLQQVLQGDCEVVNVDALLEGVQGKWQTLTEIPYSEVVHAASQCYKGRHG